MMKVGKQSLKQMAKATGLKAYLAINKFECASLVEKCHLSKSYLTQILNGERSNPRFTVIVRLAAELNLPAATVQDLLHSSYDSFISKLPKTVYRDQFSGYLEQILDALDESDFSTVTNLNDLICILSSDLAPLKSNYLCWFKALNLTFQNKFEDSIPMFIEASQFIPRYDIEKRFKAKILGGLGAAYLVRGMYRQSMKAFSVRVCFYGLKDFRWLGCI